jgi:hypothetical protein
VQPEPDPEPAEGDGIPPPADPAAAPSSHALAGRARWRRGFTAAALVLGLCGLAGAAAGVVTQFLPRTFTAAQQRQIMAWDMARRWRTMPAGKVFPAAAGYQLSGFALNAPSELSLTARRLGIARQESCAAATDVTAGRVLDRLGCKAVLRATYADSTSSMIVTVGVAVLPSGGTARAAFRDLAAAGASPGSKLLPGLRAVAFPGTLAAHFGDRQRQLNWDVSAGPYLIMSTVGFADGRPRVRVVSDAYADQEMSGLAQGVADVIRAPLGAPPPVPVCPGAPGC